ncbi:Sphingosine N-acyltransferase lag1 [Mycoemilia scoparia]|uniref:Sphingosine N-acyltransferase lag1 n=1 Tax=Mycoemilia scoparia TaxID=417184 RepID=A0A9W8DPT0_9FUNG|nr:Sphingosine N-acyltransferase lag1 [Mycoemilia scoparia]
MAAKTRSRVQGGSKAPSDVSLIEKKLATAATTNGGGIASSESNKATKGDDSIANFFVEKQGLWSGALLFGTFLGGQLGFFNTSKIYQLSYDSSGYSGSFLPRHEGSDDVRYYRGGSDIYVVLFWILGFTFLRNMVMNYILMPFARMYGVQKPKDLVRFAEQGWLTIYYSISFPAGLYVMSQCPHWMDTRHFWINYPSDHAAMPPMMKWYYLIQMGFWFQQIFVLNIEERRKDFLVMFAHHIVTCMLLVFSYWMSYTRVGNAVLITMDFADIWLTLAKCMRYLKIEKPTVYIFSFFVLSWIYTRHYLYIIIMWSAFYESSVYIDLDSWKPERFSYFNEYVVWGFTALLGLLQVLLLYWLYLILKIIYNIVFAWNIDDTRSDTEGDSDDTSASAKKKTN